MPAVENDTHGMICTYTGILIEPLSPDPALIDIRDIAHALSNQCRFTGHVRKFYSVAEHSVRVVDLLHGDTGKFSSPELLTVGLLHDASEAYLSDIARPVKRQPEIKAAYDKAEMRLMRAIGYRYGFEWPSVWHEQVKWADDVLLRSEQRDLMPDVIRIPGDEYVEFTIIPWTPEQAEKEFLEYYDGIGVYER